MAWIEPRRRVVDGKKTREVLYYVVDRVNGKRVSEPAGPMYATAKDIKKKNENGSARRASGLVVEKTLGAAYDEYNILINRTRNPKTWSAYDWALRKLVSFIGRDRNIGSIGKENIISFRASVMPHHSQNGILDILKIVRTFFSYCVDSGYVASSPAKGIAKGIKEVDVAVYLMDDQIRCLLNAISNPDLMEIRKNHAESKGEFEDIVKTVLLTGMREGDIATLRSESIRDRNIYIVRGKGGKPRVIPISQMLLPILNKYKSRGHEFVFQGWNTRRIKSRWNRLYRRALKANPKIMPGRCRFHDLRHTFASNYLRGGGTIADLKIILGHSNIKTTIRYAHFQQSDLHERMERVKADFLTPQFHVA